LDAANLTDCQGGEAATLRDTGISVVIVAISGARSGTVRTVFGEPEADGAGTGVAGPAPQYLRRR
jgi:hypothetical protein